MCFGADWHPLSRFLRPFLPADATGSLDDLNRAALFQGISTGSGAGLRFVLPSADADTLAYEERAYKCGEVSTRADNAHDLFNALIWLVFPRTKAAMNHRHMSQLRSQLRESAAHAEGHRQRGMLRDAITQFDECGVVIAGMPVDLQHALCAHRWQEVFVERRAELLATTRFVLFGHASHDALRAPFVGLCGKAIFLDVPVSCGLPELDEALACRVTSADFHRPPREVFQPLPLLGIPGATPENEAAAYYADTRQFRPPRTMRAGSSPGNR